MPPTRSVCSTALLSLSWIMICCCWEPNPARMQSNRLPEPAARHEMPCTISNRTERVGNHAISDDDMYSYLKDMTLRSAREAFQVRASEGLSGFHRRAGVARRSFFGLALVCVALSLGLMPAAGIDFRWSWSSNRIYVNGPGEA